MKVTIVIPTFNEIGGMEVIMPRIKREWYDQLIIVDGGSTDGTIEYAKRNNYPIYVQTRRGLRQGLREAHELIRGDIIITFSPDGNCIPELIPQLIEKMKDGYDMVIVSRYAEEAKSHDDDILTSFGNRLFPIMINCLFGGNYTDSLGIYRAYKKDIIDRLEIHDDPKFLHKAEDAGILIGWEPKLSIRCAKRKLKVSEIPGDEPRRICGKRKMEPFRTGPILLGEIIYEIFRWH